MPGVYTRGRKTLLTPLLITAFIALERLNNTMTMSFVLWWNRKAKRQYLISSRAWSLSVNLKNKMPSLTYTLSPVLESVKTSCGNESPVASVPCSWGRRPGWWGAGLFMKDACSTLKKKENQLINVDEKEKEIFVNLDRTFILGCLWGRLWRK